MSKHKVYAIIVEAIKQGKLKEPFMNDDFRIACPGLGEGTYNAFLHKHRVNNPGGNSELFEKTAPNRFKLVKPIKYDLDIPTI